MGMQAKYKFIDLAVRWMTRMRPPLDFPLSNFDRIRQEVKIGDVILVEGRSRVSDVIKLITQSRWSHAALYIGRLHDIENPLVRQRIRDSFDCQPDVQLIVESELGLGTVVRPLAAYDRDHLRLCRPRELTYRDAQNLVNFSVNQLGTDYDIRQIFDLFRLMMPFWLMLPRRWRSSLFERRPGKPTRTVCSTMIAEAFASIQYPILPLVKKTTQSGMQLFRRNPKLCTPSDFDYSPYFDIIKYPFVDFHASRSRYALMPWYGNARLTQEEQASVFEQGGDPAYMPLPGAMDLDSSAGEPRANSA